MGNTVSLTRKGCLALLFINPIASVYQTARLDFLPRQLHGLWSLDGMPVLAMRGCEDGVRCVRRVRGTMKTARANSWLRFRGEILVGRRVVSKL